MFYLEGYLGFFMEGCPAFTWKVVQVLHEMIFSFVSWKDVQLLPGGMSSFYLEGCPAFTGRDVQL